MFDNIIGSIRTAVTAVLPADIPNVLYDALDADITKMKATDRYIEVQTEFTDPIPMTIGARARHRQEGFIQVVLHEPSGDGDGNQLIYASQIAMGINNVVTTGTGYTTRFRNPSVANGSREGSHFVRIVRIELITDFYPHLA